jgi:CheY-like chemotaxis protein
MLSVSPREDQGVMQTILLLDDDADVQRFTRALLERAGYTVLTASDGEDGLLVFERNRATIALLLTDLRMPIMNGRELADRILQLNATLPVLMMTGDGESATGPYDCVPKPVSPVQLIRRIGEKLATVDGRHTVAAAIAGG